MERQQYLETTIRPIMENLVFQIVSERPENPASYMIDWLQKTGGYTSNNLSKDEKKELENLRLNILDYRGREGDMDDEEVIISDDDDEEEYKHNELLEDKKKVLKGKGKRTGVSAEAYGKFNKKGNFKPIFIKKNENQINRIKSRIMQSIIFGMIDEKDINIVIGAMDERNCAGGEVIIKQGEPADCLYVVEQGELDCYKRFPDGEEKKVKEYFEGDSFGELALLYNSNRAATVIARTKCVLWALDRETFNHIVKDASINKRERYEGFLKSVEALKGIDPYEMTQVCDALKQCSYKEGDYVIKEGEVGDVFYIIEEGEAIATKTYDTSKPAEIVLYYKKGDYFGELALLRGEPRAANIIAKTDLLLLTLDRKSFKRLLSPNEDFLKWKAQKLYASTLKK